MKNTFRRVLSMILCICLSAGAVPVSALGAVDDPLTGETGSGWELVTGDGGTNGGAPNIDIPTVSESGESATPPENEPLRPDKPIDSGTSEDPQKPKENLELVPGVSALNPLVLSGSLPLSKIPISWGGVGGVVDRVVFANGTFCGPPIHRVTLGGKTAFCIEWNGKVPEGDYRQTGTLGDAVIKQIVANYDASSKDNSDYMAAQIAIWAHLQGTTVASWGGNPAQSRYDEIEGGSADTSMMTCYVNDGDNITQLLLTYDKEPGAPEEGEGELRIEVTSQTDTRTDVENEKRYEYSDAIGQITIRKHDQDGMSLDGALFNIDVAFSDGSHTTVNNWEVDNGARLFTWTHPQDNHDPATVTVTEVTPPRYYEGDPTPKTAVVHPTYTRVTHVTTWTITIVTSSIDVAVIDIESGDVIATSHSSSSADTRSDPQVEEFADFVEGDRETTVTFVNRRITSDIEVIKKDANTGTPLAGATIHLWGEDLSEAEQKIDMTEVTGADGIAYFRDLPPGTYVVQETQAPHGYNLNDELQTVVLQSGQTIRKEVRNYRKDGLVIKKVDPNGKPIAGAVFELRRGSGEVLLSETTDENGTIFRDYLVEGLYVIEEKKAPEGYLLDENPIKEIFIYATDDNKEYNVTFVNKKKPAIEITKIDAETPTIKLEGAVYSGSVVKTKISEKQVNQIFPYF